MGAAELFQAARTRYDWLCGDCVVLYPRFKWKNKTVVQLQDSLMKIKRSFYGVLRGKNRFVPLQMVILTVFVAVYGYF